MDTTAASLAKNISISTSRQTVGENLFAELLTAILNGRFEPGERINDVALARELGISRTPVREALQRLRTLGIVEAEPNRFTRVAVISPEQVAENWIVILALARAVLVELDGKTPAKALKSVKAEAAAFEKANKSNNAEAAARANVGFFAALTDLSSNRALREASEGAQYLVRLGSRELEPGTDAAGLVKLHSSLVDVLSSSDLKAADKALDQARAILAR
ncbi:GntR family transcriptional regulator [Agromyces aerolatus]|uniref:GntR family transcriptional regulator n=1 Tax=Agromyces sp. LY-1074 TaxID=3074080 RepID=UPI002854EB72|nr:MULTISPECIES: GntR family transcriptional regulator [unclassified Agromyces]MDR5699964.1 GntR family transcriptional regulator [Agromyces sp. LY-1074]MDR5706224.1 GntR family transcriptional regulator [Agromyces sp. LY-1358]